MKEIIGATITVSLYDQTQIPAKIDTGADSSAIWASQVSLNQDGSLSFVLFDQSSPFYTGEIIETRHYRRRLVRSSNGTEETRYATKLPIKIGRRTINALFNLSDRSRNQYPILIGRRTLQGKFVVDVSDPGDASRLSNLSINNKKAKL